MYLQRLIDKELNKWQQSKQPKPLLIRGARQVGKTQSIRNLGKQFQYFIEINFESNKQIHSVFEGNLSAGEISENISVIFRTPVKEGATLLFFDEVQACIPAIQALRFFYEQKPGLHVIAAGSLLEFALLEIPSFGVGRIRSLFMYSFSFDEFLLAFNEDRLLKMKQKATPKTPLNKAVHEKLLRYLRKFFILGGMPEVVSDYVENKDLNHSQLILNDLKNSYFDDFAKYKKLVPPLRIRHVFSAVAMQTGNKFIYTRTPANDNHRQLKEAMELLILSGVVIPVTHTSANGLPLGAEANYKKQKMLLIDTGLFLNMLNLDIGKIILTDDFATINKGALAELFVGLELLKYHSPYQKAMLYYWHREARSSNAEVDYVVVQANEIVPVEIKAGKRGAMRSMNIFMESKKSNTGIRISSENFSEYNGIQVVPLYAVSNIFR